MPSANIGQVWNYNSPGVYTFIVPESGLYNLKCSGAQGGGGPSVLDNWEIVSYNYSAWWMWTIHHQFWCGLGPSSWGDGTYTTNTRCPNCGEYALSLEQHTVKTPVYSWVAHNVGSLPGLGGTISGDIYLKKGEILNIYVGGKGSLTHSLNSGGGFNGGGHGGPGGCGGGGATDIRYKGITLKSRFIVAGGGGGSDDYGTSRSNQNDFNKSGLAGSTEDGSGGNGGGMISQGGRYNGFNYGAYAASQNSGNDLGQGQNVTVNADCGGGGGGYYGGKTGNSASWGGAGGSSYLSPAFKNTTNTQGDNAGNGSAVITLLKMFNFQHYALKVKDKEEYYIMSDELKQNGYYMPVPRDYLFDVSNNKNYYVNSLAETFKNGIPEQLRGKSIQVMKIQGYRLTEYDNADSADPLPDNFGYGIYKGDEINEVDLYKTHSVPITFKMFLNSVKRSVIKLTNNINVLFDSYITSFFINSSNITFAFQDEEIIYGKNFDIINQNEIYEKGFTKDDLIYLKEIPLNNFNILMVFNKEISTDNLSLIKIINTIPALRSKINEIDYDILIDKTHKSAFIKFGKDYDTSIYLNKIEKTVENYDSINSMQQF